VLLAHHSDLKSRKLSLDKFNFPPIIDLVCVELSIFTSSILVIVVYIAPDIDINTYDCFLDSLAVLIADVGGYIFIAGDFNTPHLENPTDGRSRSLSRFLGFSGLQQHNKVCNSNSRKLDLVLTNMDCATSRSDVALVPEDPLHPTLLSRINIPPTNPNFVPNVLSKRFNFKRADYPSLYSTISSIDWSCIRASSDVNEVCDRFYKLLMEPIKTNVPVLITKRNPMPAWYTPELIKMVKLKERAHKRYTKCRSIQSYQEFSSVRSQVKTLLSNAYKSFILTAELKIKSQPKNFWNFVNSKRQRSRIPGEMLLNGRVLSNEQSIVDGFAEYFSSVYLPPSAYQVCASTSPDSNLINIPELTEGDIIKACRSLAPNLSSGPDAIPAFLLNDCAYILASPLKTIFNLCIQLGKFPDRWKLSNVCPILKAGNKGLVTNYRPISLLSNFSKVFKKAVNDKLLAVTCNKISTHQHGFLKGRSTSTNLACLTQFVSSTLDAGAQVDVIYTDFAKAFDSVDHLVLLNKLQLFGFSTNSLKFFGSYLSNRPCSVTYNGFKSSIFLATSGVPQGSVLGPTLFLLFINDLAHSLKCHKLLFADDLKIFSRIDHTGDCHALQTQLNLVEAWCKSNKLELNIDKCKVVSYTKRLVPIEHNYVLYGVILTRASNIKDLGVTFDSKLRFNLHIEGKVKQALRMLGFIVRTCKELTNTDCIVLLYNAFVRSILEYASIIWCPYYTCYIDLIEDVQRKFLKYLFFKKHNCYPTQGYPQSALLCEFGFLSLDTRRNFLDLKFLNKILHNVINMDSSYFCLPMSRNRENSRMKHIFYVPYANTNVFRHSPLIRLCRLGNQYLPVLDISKIKPADLTIKFLQLSLCGT